MHGVVRKLNFLATLFFWGGMGGGTWLCNEIRGVSNDSLEVRNHFGKVFNEWSSVQPFTSSVQR